MKSGTNMKTKKQRREAFIPGNNISASALLDQSTKESFVKGAESHQGSISLNLGNGESASFTLQTVEPQDILTKTVVFEGNDRIQDTLNPLTLNDILPSIRKFGMTYPAIGRLRSDGKIEVLEGSRRRYSCHLANKPYMIYVADSDSVTYEVAKHLSDVGNVYKPLSQYEQGRRYQAMVDNNGMSQADVARSEGISRAKVTQAITAYLLPIEFYQAFASGFEIGRPTITRLRKIYDSAVSVGIQSELLRAVKKITPASLSEVMPVTPLALPRITTDLIKNLRENYQSVSHLSVVPSFTHLSDLLAHPELVDELGLGEKINQILDKKALAVILEESSKLDTSEASAGKAVEAVPFFEGKTVNIGRKELSDGSIQFVFRKMNDQEKTDIDQLILDYFRNQSS